jgi:hypothetical protein
MVKGRYISSSETAINLFRVTAMPGGKSAPIFSDYRFMYLGGAASPHNGAFIRVNPTDPFGFK